MSFFFCAPRPGFVCIHLCVEAAGKREIIQWEFFNVFFARLGQGSSAFSHAWRPQRSVRSSMGVIKVWPFLSNAVLFFGICLEPGSKSSFQGRPKRNARFPFVWNRLLLFRTCFEPPRRHVLRGCPTHFCDFEPPSRLAL